MKKLFIIMAAGTFVLSSCKKDWTCECTVAGTPYGVSETIKDKKKNDAQSECQSKGGSGIVMGMEVTVTCDIK